MKIARVHIKSVSPYSQSRPHNEPKKDKESADDHERRTWRMRLHTTEDGHVFIPPMQFKMSLAAAAQYLGLKIPGKRNATWTKHFEAGVLVMDGPVLPIKAEDVEPEWLYVNADGKRGSGTRVWRCYPKVTEWEADVDFYVLDDSITEDAFLHHLKEAGKFIGIGRWRPRQGGLYGRFRVTSCEWREAENEAA